MADDAPDDIDDEEVPDIAAQMTDVLAQLSDDSLTGFAVVMEWVNPEGQRSLSLLKPNSTPPWEVQGWMFHVMNQPETFDAIDFMVGDDDFDDGDE